MALLPGVLCRISDRLDSQKQYLITDAMSLCAQQQVEVCSYLSDPTLWCALDKAK